MSCSVPVVIDDLPISPFLISKLKTANLISLKEILTLPMNDLQRIAKISPYHANIVIQAVSIAELKTIEKDAFSMLNSSRRECVPFKFLKSGNFTGVYTGTITEICGESGVGKTQLCLEISICALAPLKLEGLASKVIYIHSEGKFPIERFIELSESFKRNNESDEDYNLADNLILKKVYNLKETIHVLQKGIPDLIHKKECRPKVIVIDSVAALLRGEFDSFNTRIAMIQQLADELWKLAHVYQMAVICVNQVSGSIQRSTNTSSNVSTDIPSLGLLWANVLTTRIKLFRRAVKTGSVIHVRTFEVVFSPYHPRLIINFGISKHGIDTLSEYLIQ